MVVANKKTTTPAILLSAYADESEVRDFCEVCRESAHPMIDKPSDAPLIEVILIGAAQMEAARRAIARHDRLFSLLIAHDAAVLRCPDVLKRCHNVLIAPFDRAQLLDVLRDIGGEELDAGVYENIVGRSPQIRELLRLMSILSQYDAPVLVKGETGTGKELVARGIHYSSARRDQPFVPVNCGALNDELLLAELFGYEKGAFTDAKRSHRGLVDQAGGGVLFLDEIDSLSPRGQAMLLRFLQEQEYRPLGGNAVIKSNVRVVTATNKDLAQRVAQGLFREDLYYRVHLLDIRLPPLRTRAGDIDVLSEHFLLRLCERHGARKQLHPLTREWMLAYDWPGNVRELQNFLYRVFVLSRGPTIYVPQIKGDPVALRAADRVDDAIGGEQNELCSFSVEKNRVLEQFERRYLHQIMQASKGNVSLAARNAGKERRAFRRLMKKHGIDRHTYN